MLIVCTEIKFIFSPMAQVKSTPFITNWGERSEPLCCQLYTVLSVCPCPYVRLLSTYNYVGDIYHVHDFRV